MGYWSKLIFGLDILPSTCFLFGGVPWKRNEIEGLLKHFDYHRKLDNTPLYISYIVRKDQKEFLLCWGAYGSTITAEILKILKDGRCKNIIFIGWAYSPKNLELHSIVIPNKIRNLDGVTSFVNKARFSYPNKSLFETVINQFKRRNIKFITKPCITVPYFFWNDISTVHEESKKYYALDMEGSVILSYSKYYGLRSVVIYIITDSENISLEESNKPKYRKHRLGVVYELVNILTELEL